MKSRPPRTPAIAIRKAARGYSAEGPGFYVWDEDANEVQRLARQLGGETPTLPSVAHLPFRRRR